MLTAKRRLLSAAIAVAVLGAGLAACARTVTPGAAGAPARTASSPAATSAPNPSITPTPAPTHVTPQRASAAGQLAGFFAAAQVADGTLRHAAVLVNQGVGKKSLSFSPEALAAVRALDTSAVARAIPAGLPPDSGLRNSGCGSCGGYVSTALSKIVWQPKNEPVMGHSDGYISGIRFRADYHPGHGWSVEIWAC